MSNITTYQSKAPAATTQNAGQLIGNLLASKKKAIESVLPKHLTPERLMRLALSTINNDSKLAKCTGESLLSCIITSATLGLEPDGVTGRCYLIPYYSNKDGKFICTFQVGYKGLAELAFRSGQVKSITAREVYEHDEFELEFGLEPKLKHVPYGGDDPGEITGVYCVVTLKDGGSAYDYMTKVQIERIRQRSQSKDKGPWVTDWVEMAKKTVFKRLSKLLPLSTEFMSAVATDNANETRDPDAAAAPAIWETVSHEENHDAHSEPQASKGEQPKREVGRLRAVKAGTSENRGHGEDNLAAVGNASAGKVSTDMFEAQPETKASQKSAPKSSQNQEAGPAVSLDNQKEALLIRFSKMRIPLSVIEESIGDTKDAWTEDDIRKLTEIADSIQGGHSIASDHFDI